MISPTYVDFTSTTTQVSVTIGGVLDGEPEENETVTIRFTTASANVQDFDYTITVVDATGEGPTVLCVCVYPLLTCVLYVCFQATTYCRCFQNYFRGGEIIGFWRSMSYMVSSLP